MKTCNTNKLALPRWQLELNDSFFWTAQQLLWVVYMFSMCKKLYNQNRRGDFGNWLELCLCLPQQLGPNWLTMMPPPVHFWYDCNSYLKTSYMGHDIFCSSQERKHDLGAHTDISILETMQKGFLENCPNLNTLLPIQFSAACMGDYIHIQYPGWMNNKLLSIWIVVIFILVKKVPTGQFVCWKKVPTGQFVCCVHLFPQQTAHLSSWYFSSSIVAIENLQEIIWFVFFSL